MICPKCGFEQKESPVCIACKIVIKNFLELYSNEETKKNATQVLFSPTNKKIIKAVLFISIALFITAFFKKSALPKKDSILQELYQAPIQTKTYTAPFDSKIRKINYTITPLYRYELYGMIVSYHHSKSWWDLYHSMWNDFINIKDICVIWGDNIKTEVYKDMKFSSGSWTCYYKWPNKETAAKFKNTCLSNNHLLSDSKELNKTIMRAKVGDQIYLKGYLSKYSHSNDSFTRGTSTTRTDQKNGCETIYLKDFRILKEGNPSWRFIFSLSKYSIIICLILLILFIFKEPFGKRPSRL